MLDKFKKIVLSFYPEAEIKENPYQGFERAFVFLTEGLDLMITYRKSSNRMELEATSSKAYYSKKRSFYVEVDEDLMKKASFSVLRPEKTLINAINRYLESIKPAIEATNKRVEEKLAYYSRFVEEKNTCLDILGFPRLPYEDVIESFENQSRPEKNDPSLYALYHRKYRTDEVAADAGVASTGPRASVFMRRDKATISFEGLDVEEAKALYQFYLTQKAQKES